MFLVVPCDGKLGFIIRDGSLLNFTSQWIDMSTILEILLVLVAGRRDFRGSDLRGKLDRRRSPIRRYSPVSDARGRHTLRGQKFYPYECLFFLVWVHLILISISEWSQLLLCEYFWLLSFWFSSCTSYCYTWFITVSNGRITIRYSFPLPVSDCSYFVLLVGYSPTSSLGKQR